MTTQPFIAAQTGLSRVFLIEGRARPGTTPTYESGMRAGSLSHGTGDTERIEIPSSRAYDQFVEVGIVRGAQDRPSMPLEGRYALDLESKLYRLAKAGCPMDVQVHLGQCANPSDFNEFTKAVILEGVYLTQYSTEDLGSLASGDRAAINETVDISAEVAYEVLPLSFSREADDITTTRITDVVICDTPACADCGQTDGCRKIFALTIAAGGSVGTPADIIFSLNKGASWAAHDIDTLGATQTPSALDCVGDYLVVVANGDCALHYALLSEFDGVTDPTWTRVTTGFNAAGCPADISFADSKAYVVGNGGYIYELTDPVGGVTVLDAGNATTDDFNAVHAPSDNFVVAVGNNGAIAVSENGTNFRRITPPVVAGVHFLSVWVKSEKVWLIGANNGNLYHTLNGGKTWTTQSFPGSGSGNVYAIAFSTDSVGYMAHATSTPSGRILRTFDGGNSWVILPEGVGSLPAHASTRTLATCRYDPNFVVGGGVATGGVDGILLVGED